MFDKLNLVSLARQRMDWVAQRQEVLSENIANADTPKFAPQDLKPFKDVLGQTVAPVNVAVTDPHHIVPVVKDSLRVYKDKKAFESSPDGNAVVLDEQMAKLGEARTAYDVAASLFQKQYKMIRSALGKNM